MFCFFIIMTVFDRFPLLTINASTSIYCRVPVNKFSSHLKHYLWWSNLFGCANILDGKCFRRSLFVCLEHLEGARHPHGFRLQLVLWVNTMIRCLPRWYVSWHLVFSPSCFFFLFSQRYPVPHRQLPSAACCFSQEINFETSRVLHHQPLHQRPWDDPVSVSTGDTVGLFTQVSRCHF